MFQNLHTTIARMRIIALFEGVSFLIILFVTMPLKYMMDMGMPNKIFGMAHGVLFVAYVFYTILAHADYKWNFKRTGLVLLASVIPFGTFYIDAKILKPQQNAIV